VDVQTTALFGNLRELQTQMQNAVGQDATSIEELMQKVQVCTYFTFPLQHCKSACMLLCASLLLVSMHFASSLKVESVARGAQCIMKRYLLVSILWYAYLCDCVMGQTSLLDACWHHKSASVCAE